jgi:hypothetical protein
MARAEKELGELQRRQSEYERLAQVAVRDGCNLAMRTPPHLSVPRRRASGSRSNAPGGESSRASGTK